jgi:hypothetical protein
MAEYCAITHDLSRKKNRMQTCTEQLPVEVWLTIFQYLEAHDIFHAFHNLNYYFNQILASNHLLFYVRLKDTDRNQPKYSTNPYWSDSVLNRTIWLRPRIRSQSNYFLHFLDFNANKLIRLQSLSLRVCPPYTSSISQSLKQLSVLEYLSLTCTSDQIVLESILFISTLRICRLSLRESMTKINHHHLDIKSNIEQLFIVFLDKINYSVIDNLLIYTPKLKRLEISGSHYSFEQVTIFNKQLFILPELRIFKLKLEDGHFESDCFKCLPQTMPLLKHFYFNYNKLFLSETFLIYFISNWWSIIKQIRYLNVHIEGRLIIDLTSNNTKMNLQKNKEILLSKNNQSNGSFKIKWDEKVFTMLKHIEITIVKS